MPAGRPRSSRRGCGSRRSAGHARRESRDLVALLLANTRTPRERLGDLRAQRGANHLTATRLRALADELGADGLAAAMAATLDHAERAVTAAVRELPDGTYHFEDALDDDGTGVGPIPIRAVPDDRRTAT
jgi:N-methylhydantoinase B